MFGEGPSKKIAELIYPVSQAVALLLTMAVSSNRLAPICAPYAVVSSTGRNPPQRPTIHVAPLVRTCSMQYANCCCFSRREATPGTQAARGCIHFSTLLVL